MARKSANQGHAPQYNGAPVLSESQMRIERYSAIARTVDALGRSIGVRRLKPSEQSKLQGMTQDLAGFDEATGDDGQKVQVPHRMPLFIAAAVREIIGTNGVVVPVPFPRNRAELDAIYDRLDQEGIDAALRAFAQLSAETGTGNTVEDAKN